MSLANRICYGYSVAKCTSEIYNEIAEMALFQWFRQKQEHFGENKNALEMMNNRAIDL
nr:MAG TPA: hypothetical protein [Caudoviricetes sp.]